MGWGVCVRERRYQRGGLGGGRGNRLSTQRQPNSKHSLTQNTHLRGAKLRAVGPHAPVPQMHQMLNLGSECLAPCLAQGVVEDDHTLFCFV